MTGCYHDPDRACNACQHYERIISDLENTAWRRNSIARVLIEEPNGLQKVARILSIQSTLEGKVIRVI